jgi:LemA protein
MMTAPVLLGLLAATALFWAVGAYNRLVRLRSDVVRAFSALDNVLAVQPALIQASLPASMPQVPNKNAAEWDRLSAVGAQYALSLANARSRPLDPEAIAALSAAQRVLDGVWEHAAVYSDDGDAAAAALLDGLQARLARLAEQAVGPGRFFDAAVMAYNIAIGQFPALILARIWGFKPAGSLRSMSPD